MPTFKEKVTSLGLGQNPSTAALTFLSDLSTEDRTTVREEWPRLPVARRRNIVGHLVTMAEDNLELYFRPMYLVALDDSDAKVRLSAIEGLYEDNSKLTMGKLIE